MAAAVMIPKASSVAAAPQARIFQGSSMSRLSKSFCSMSVLPDGFPAGDVEPTPAGADFADGVQGHAVRGGEFLDGVAVPEEAVDLPDVVLGEGGPGAGIEGSPGDGAPVPAGADGGDVVLGDPVVGGNGTAGLAVKDALIDVQDLVLTQYVERERLHSLPSMCLRSPRRRATNSETSIRHHWRMGSVTPLRLAITMPTRAPSLMRSASASATHSAAKNWPPRSFTSMAMRPPWGVKTLAISPRSLLPDLTLRSMRVSSMASDSPSAMTRSKRAPAALAEALFLFAKQLHQAGRLGFQGGQDQLGPVEDGVGVVHRADELFVILAAAERVDRGGRDVPQLDQLLGVQGQLDPDVGVTAYFVDERGVTQWVSFSLGSACVRGPNRAEASTRRGGRPCRTCS